LCHDGDPVFDIARQHNACIPLSAVFNEAEGRTVHEHVNTRRSRLAWRSWHRIYCRLNTKPVGISLLTNAVGHSALMNLARRYRQQTDSPQ
jgi:hypothetical protein